MPLLHLMKFQCVLLASVFLIACSTVGVKPNDLSVGAKKSVVVETLGSPDRSWRKDGKDFWFYGPHSADPQEKMILVFENGVLSEKHKPGDADDFQELEAELQKLKNPKSEKFETLSE